MDLLSLNDIRGASECVLNSLEMTVPNEEIYARIQLDAAWDI